MSAAPDLGESVDRQLQSKLFIAPTEIRHAIYSHTIAGDVHAFLHKGQLHLSKCLARKPVSYEDFDGSSRRPTDPGLESRGGQGGQEGVIWARRLASSWGPHWECEELAMKRDEARPDSSDPMQSMLLTCKRLYYDVVDFTMGREVVHIAGLNTLAHMLQETATPSVTSSYLSAAFGSVKRLHLTLRLPLVLCKALEQSALQAGSESPSAGSSYVVDHHWDSQIEKWQQLYAGIARLKRLRKLKVWLDNDSMETWATSNERSILSPFIIIGAKTEVELAVDVPKLHPRWETPERHLTADCPDHPPFDIHRRLPQRCYGRDDSQGGSKVGWFNDFPELLEHPVLEGCTLEEIEQNERRLWKSGIDPMDEYADVVISWNPQWE